MESWSKRSSSWCSASVFLVWAAMLSHNFVISTVAEFGDNKNYYSPDPNTPTTVPPPHGTAPPSHGHHPIPTPYHGTPPLPPSHGGGGGAANCGTPPSGGHRDHHTSPPPTGGGGYYHSPPPTVPIVASPPPTTPTHVTPTTPIVASPPPTTPTHVTPTTPIVASPPPTTPIVTPTTPIVASPPIDPGTPGITIPSPPFSFDPNSPPFTCTYWRNHPTLIWGLFGWWGTTLGSAFGVTSLPGVGASSMNILQALSNTRSDGLGQLYREGTAALLNSVAHTSFPYTTTQVRDRFLAALSSNKAAAQQAQIFKHANEGKTKPTA